ncbi:MAG: molybdopterin-dependent oxidoreductase [Planctomycetaceae bacterium]
MTDITIRKTACPRDCPDACGLLVTLENDHVTRIQGDPAHPVTRGFICERTSRFVERQTSKHRLTTPLYRRHQSAELEPISWQAALDIAAERLTACRAESGGESIFQYRCGGSLGIVKHVGDYFFHRFGPVTTRHGDICSGAGEAAQVMDFGECNCNDFFDIRHSRTVFLWGKNVFASSIHLIPELKNARKNGATIVLIDPVHHRTASIADLTVQPRPGTDAAIALGICRWLIDHRQIDETAGKYCDHLPEFLRMVTGRTVSEWAQLADIPLGQFEMIAAAYAGGPTCSLIGWGLQRRRFGATTVRTIDALAAVSGNIGRPGGGASFYYVRRGAFDFSSLPTESSARTIAEPLLGEELQKASDPPIRMAWVWGANPVAMLPDSATVAEAFRTREFTVVVDPFLTDTARCANLVLPTTTFLEEDDLRLIRPSLCCEVSPVTTPPAGVLSDYEIFREIAKRTGMADEFDVDVSVWKERLLKRLTDHGISRSQIRDGYVRNPFTPEVLFADRQFPTQSGRINLIHELPEAMWAVTEDLRLTAVSTAESQASQWEPESQVGPVEVVIHPSVSGGHADGSVITVRSHRSSLKARLKFDPNQRADVMLMKKGGWHFAGRSANSLIFGELTDAGDCAVYYDTPVTIE